MLGPSDQKLKQRGPSDQNLTLVCHVSILLGIEIVHANERSTRGSRCHVDQPDDVTYQLFATWHAVNGRGGTALIGCHNNNNNKHAYAGIPVIVLHI